MLKRAGTFIWYCGLLVAAVAMARFATTLSPAGKSTAITPAVIDPPTGVQPARKKRRAGGGGRMKIDWSSAQRYLKAYDRKRVWKGLNLVPTSGTEEVLLINMSGKLVHKWDVDAARARLLPNGNLLVVHGSAWGETKARWKKLMPVVNEYDWNGNVVWSYTTESIAHHDIQRLDNGNTLILIHVDVPPELQQKAEHPARREGRLLTDAIIEVTPDGEIVWRWNLYDHFDVNFCGARPCVVTKEDRQGDLKDAFRRDWTHSNSIFALPENRWYDQGDTRFKPGNVLLNPRRFWRPIIIEKETGKVVWEYTEKEYRGGLGAPHEARMIQPGLPGAGNIVIFDNGIGSHNGESFIVELNPVKKKVVWTFDRGTKFFNKTRGSHQRLPNGNTLISWDREGRVLEVNPAGETMWDYDIPIDVVRAHRYRYDYCEQCKQFAEQ